MSALACYQSRVAFPRRVGEEAGLKKMQGSRLLTRRSFINVLHVNHGTSVAHKDLQRRCLAMPSRGSSSNWNIQPFEAGIGKHGSLSFAIDVNSHQSRDIKCLANASRTHFSASDNEIRDAGDSGNESGPISKERRGVRLMELPLEVIRRPLMLTRKNDEEKVCSLMESIAEIGLQEPIEVLEVDGQYYGFSGCHRFEAHVRLGLPSIKCRVRRATVETLRYVTSKVVYGLDYKVLCIVPLYHGALGLGKSKGHMRIARSS